jgi:hypothetical protein
MSAQSTDRTVHAVTVHGHKIVRYAIAGAWYLERTDGSRRRMTLAEAVGYATLGGSEVQLGLPGGSHFDAKVRRRQFVTRQDAR